MKKLLLFRIEKSCLHIMKKSAAVWNRTRDLLYYTPHVYSPSKNQACAKLVGCLTYHKRITIWHLCKQQTTPWNAICYGILLWASYIGYFSIILSMSTIVICSYMSCWKAWATSKLKHTAHLSGHKKPNKLDDRKNFQF